MDDRLRAGCERTVELSRFVPRALAAAVGAEATDAARLDALCTLAAEPWPRARLEAELDALSAAGADLDEEEALALRLRRLRRRVLLALAARDIAGVAPLPEVVGTMTSLAELAVERALHVHAPALAQVHGVPLAADGTPQDLLVVAMGKGGGGELNVSSDLDLIFVYDEDGTTARYGCICRCAATDQPPRVLRETWAAPDRRTFGADRRRVCLSCRHASASAR